MIEWDNIETLAQGRPAEKVLDKGFVILADYMGNDDSIVTAARISTGQGTKTPAEDRGLIRYLMRNNHTTPFEMVEFQFLVKVPMFVWRQWIRHRTASVNEMSARYVELSEQFFVPELSALRRQSKSMKQGRSDTPVDPVHAQTWRTQSEISGHTAFREYRLGIELGLGKEIARIGLPLSTYTVAYWKIDLHNLFRFLGLRLDSHAQEEVRVYAEAIARMVKDVCPVAYEAFEDFHLNAISLSADEIHTIKTLLDGAGGKAMGFDPLMVDSVLADCIHGKGEQTELRAKLTRLGFAVKEKP
jgi:thymidylate synthase (FAD)